MFIESFFVAYYFYNPTLPTATDFRNKLYRFEIYCHNPIAIAEIGVLSARFAFCGNIFSAFITQNESAKRCVSVLIVYVLNFKKAVDYRRCFFFFLGKYAFKSASLKRSGRFFIVISRDFSSRHFAISL